jgi:hypothetical protein
LRIQVSPDPNNRLLIASPLSNGKVVFTDYTGCAFLWDMDTRCVVPYAKPPQA